MEPTSVHPGNRRALLVESSASTIPILMTQGAIFTAIAVYFSVDVVGIAYAAAVPMVMQVAQLAGPSMIRAFRGPVRLFRFATVLRWLWGVLIVAAFAGIRTPGVFFVVFILTQAAAAVAGNAWMSILQADLSENERGTFFGTRNVLVSATTVIAVPFMSVLLDVLPEPFSIVAVIATGLAANFVAWQAVGRIHEEPAAALDGRIPVRAIWADRPARRMIIAFFVWNTILLFSAPYFAYHQVVNLQIPMSILGLATVGISLLTMASSRAWGVWADRIGTKSITVIGVIVIAVTPVVWLLMNPRTWAVGLIADMILTSTGWGALNVGMATLPMEVAPREKASGFYAMYFAIGALGGLVGAAAGGAFAGLVEPARFTVFGTEFFGLQILMLVASVLRLLIIPVIHRVPTRRYVSPRHLMVNALSVIARRSPVRPVEFGRITRFGFAFPRFGKPRR
ncbi:MAG: MFS transporter [Spirochaetaceae bacterium]